jgi:cyanophycinase
MKSPKGTLIPIGGNEDKGIEVSELYSLEFISEGILYHVVKESGGPKGLFVVIPTASSIPEEVGENYLTAFSKLGCENVKVLDIRNREESNLAENLKLVENASCVMFSGGDQSKITDKIEGTLMHQLISDRFQNDNGFVLAGTSAGAMAMSKEMISGGSSVESFVKGAVRMYYGLGLLPNVMIDTHFIKRGRFGRVSEAVAKHPDWLGIGLAEDTGLIIKNGNEMTVIGSGMVIVFDGADIIHNNHKIVPNDTPLTLTGLRVHVLSDADKFFIKERTVEATHRDIPLEVN